MEKSGSGNTGRMARDPVPPLRVWTAVLIIITMLAALSAVPYHRFFRTEEAQLVSYERDRLRSFAEQAGPPGENIKIIALGTSLLACATYFDNNMEEFSLNSGSGRLNFLRITRGALSLDQLSPMLDDILAARPDILIIEKDAIFYRVRVPVKERVRQHSDFTRKHIKAAITSVFADRAAVLPAPPVKPVNLMDSDEELEKMQLKQGASAMSEYAEMRKSFIGPEDYANKDLAESFLALAQKNNIRVVLLDIPRSREASALIPEADRLLMDAYSDTYKRLYGVSSLRFPDKPGLEYFRDYSHLNFRGREIFSRWLLSELRKMGVGDRI